jgi:hypothetical protein
MPKKTKAPAPPPPATEAKSDAGAVLNKARAAFDQYRKKATAHEGAARPPGWGAPLPGFPPGVPFPPGAMPAWGPPPPVATGLPSGIPWPIPGSAAPLPAAGAPAGPLFESVGQMLQLGVAFATAAFAGGLQVMQGFTGPLGAANAWPMPSQGGGGHPCGCGCDCGQPSRHDCHGGCSCSNCCEDQCGDCCCRPGVRNCSCCCC